MSRVLGIDIGGSRSRARLAVGDQLIAESEARSASLAAEGPAAALDALDQLTSRLPLAQWRPIDAVCVGAAGMLGETAQRLFSERLSAMTMCQDVVVVSDAALVLPAAGLDDGVGIVCGTGAAACGQAGTQRCLVGGWGYLLGDEGGAYGVVRSAVRLVAGRSDRGRPLGPLGDALLNATGANSAQDLKTAFYVEHRPSKWAALAPIVLSSGDEAIPALLDTVTRALDDMVDAVIERLHCPDGLPVILAGGLTAGPLFQEQVIGSLRRSRPGTGFAILTEPPVAGAVKLAQQHSANRVIGRS